MSDVMRVLSQIEQGDAQAVEKLPPLVYDELRKLAAAKLAGADTAGNRAVTGGVFEAGGRPHKTHLVES